MQTVEEHRGVSTKSQLFNSLKVYLNNKKRLQPIIGLSSIIECVKADTQNREVLFLCEVCSCRLSKADMRNHITGSLHRYNYIRAWHPHLVSEWKEKSDLSKLAWPLMEMAKVLEGNEGPGEVQWLEVEDTVYQQMATHSENDAVTLITILRDGQCEPEIYSETTAVQPEHCPLGRWKSTSLGPSVLAGNSSSFLDGYTGTKPLIGLFRMVECRSEDGHTYCFLCHCCRVRANKKDIIDHLTGSSHLVNYLMEIQPEQVEVIMADVNDNYQLLQSLAKKVEHEVGRGELQVVNAPESTCRLLTGKSYNWCINMLCNGWAHSNTQKQRIAVKGPSVNKTSSYRDVPEKCTTSVSQRWKKRTAKRKMRGGTNTVFSVSLPLNKGSMLLERSSFTMDSPVPSAYLPSSSPDPDPSPESQSEDCELDYDTGSFPVNHAEHSSHLNQDLCWGNTDSGQRMEPERKFPVSQYQVYGYFSDNEHFNQSEDITETKYQKVCGENSYNGQHGYQERTSNGFYKDWRHQGPQTQNTWLSPDLSQTQDWSPYNSSYGRKAGCTEQWFNSTSHSQVDTRVSRGGQYEMTSHATQHNYYYDQEPQKSVHGTRSYKPSLQTANVGLNGLSGERAGYSDAARIDVLPGLGDPHAHSGSIALEPGVPFLEGETIAYTYGNVHHWS